MKLTERIFGQDCLVSLRWFADSINVCSFDSKVVFLSWSQVFHLENIRCQKVCTVYELQISTL